MAVSARVTGGLAHPYPWVSLWTHLHPCSRVYTQKCVWWPCVLCCSLFPSVSLYVCVSVFCISSLSPCTDGVLDLYVTNGVRHAGAYNQLFYGDQWTGTYVEDTDSPLVTNTGGASVHSAVVDLNGQFGKTALDPRSLHYHLMRNPRIGTASTIFRTARL